MSQTQSATIIPGATVRPPNVQILVNGGAVPVLSAEVQSNNFYQADSYSATLALADERVKQVAGYTWWAANSTGSSYSPVLVTMQLDAGTTPQPNWVTMIVGEVDSLEFDPVEGLLHIHGRDRTAEFIDSKTAMSFPNQTSSEMVAKIAALHAGLQTQITPTTTPIDRYYSSTFAKITGESHHSSTEWDLLTELAQLEGFDVFIQGNTLYFQAETPLGQNPYVLSIDAVSRPYVIANGYDIKFGRTLMLAKDVEVTVRSYNTNTKKTISVTSKASGVKNPAPGVPTPKGGVSTTQYVFTKPNLTIQQATAYAQQKRMEISRHERTVSFGMAGETALTPRQTLRVTGTGTDLDMDYYIHEITRTISCDEFLQTVGAKNAPPKNDSLVVG